MLDFFEMYQAFCDSIFVHKLKLHSHKLKKKSFEKALFTLHTDVTKRRFKLSFL